MRCCIAHQCDMVLKHAMQYAIILLQRMLIMQSTSLCKAVRRVLVGVLA